MALSQILGQGRKESLEYFLCSAWTWAITLTVMLYVFINLQKGSLRLGPNGKRSGGRGVGGFGGRKEKKETASFEWSLGKNTSRRRPPTQKLIAYISDAP